MISENTIDDELIDCIQLIRSPNVGPTTFYNLIKLYKTPKQGLLAINEILKRKKQNILPRELAEKELELARLYGADIITYKDKSYPDILKKIHSPPPLITLIGNKNALSQNLIGIVGSRSATINGRIFTATLTQKLGEHKIYTVSGMALGIDSAVHAAAVKYNYITVGVLGSGINVNYPKNNRDLYKKIIEKNGAIISEFAFNEEVRRENFPRRNRIISGLSLAVVVIEANKKSGSLITANLALEQGREVFAVPGSPFDLNSAGTNQLIKDGAMVITSADDIINNIYINRSKQDNELFNNQQIYKKQNNEHIYTNKQNNLVFDILNKINTSGTRINDVLDYYTVNKKTIYTILLELEISGYIHTDSTGKIYKLLV